ncbi:MAG: hypothetical protein ABFD79_06445, partial [Phycisphaerales bacterium]
MQNPQIAKKLPALAFVALCASLILVACDVPTGSDSSLASLRITVSGSPQAQAPRNLVPACGIDIASWSLHGAGPDWKTFDLENLSGAVHLIEALAPGEWNVTACGANAAGTILVRSAATSVTLTRGKAVDLNLVCRIIAGFGSFETTLSWPSGFIVTPQLAGTLTPAQGGADTPLTFTVDASGFSASLAPPVSVAAGWYRLGLRLKDLSA